MDLQPQLLMSSGEEVTMIYVKTKKKKIGFLPFWQLLITKRA